jgi:hypothetical protein
MTSASGDEETASLNLSSGQEKKKAPEANKFRRVSVVLFVAVSCFIAASFALTTPPAKKNSSRRLEWWYPGCFSSKTQVNVLHKGHLPVSKVKIGDFVQSRQDGSFSRVWGFEHKSNGKAEFYQLRSSSGPLLELTERHMVYLNSKKLPVPASQVRVGDVLKTTNHTNKGVVVEEIKVIHDDEGYYNVFTDDGAIVTNDGVVASSWIAGSNPDKQSEFYDVGPFTQAIHWHTLAQVVHAPLRFTCKAVWFGFCSNEHFHDAEDGMPKYILFLLKLESLPVWLQFILFPLVFGLGLIFTLLEYGYDNSHNVLNAMISNLGVGAVSATAAAIIPSLGFFYFQNKQHSSSLNARKQN